MELQQDTLKIKRSFRDKRKVCITITREIKKDIISFTEHINISKLKKYLGSLK